MKLVHAAWIPLLAALAPADADELRVVYRTEEVVSLEEHDWFSMELAELSMRFNGEERPEEDLEEMKAGMLPEGQDDRVSTTTWLEAVEEGRPVRARRRFDALTRTNVVGDEETEEEGVVVGRTLVLSGSADDDEVEAQLAEGDEGPPIDDAYLEHHRLTYEFEPCLPERAVAVGDTWELDEAAVREVLGLDLGEPNYFEADAEENPLEEALKSSADVSGDVVYERREDVDGVTCAVLLISLRIKVDEVDLDPAEEDASAKVAFEMESEERLWFAIEEGRPVRKEAEFEGRVGVFNTTSDAEQGMETEFAVVQKITGGYEGTWSYEER